jgi:drug/metabolite transporter superfamily protein YnfA
MAFSSPLFGNLVKISYNYYRILLTLVETYFCFSIDAPCFGLFVVSSVMYGVFVWRRMAVVYEVHISAVLYR